MMGVSFGNPLGFWALLGLPAVIAIHFLQRRVRREVITTLFLLETLQRESEAGRSWERLRSSWPFWLQLLMVLLLTWLLVQPRWRRTDTVQQIAVVLDASASMQAFRSETLAALEQHVMRWNDVAARTEYTLLTSAPESPALYHGFSWQELVAEAKASWQSWLGAHDVTAALRHARSLAGPEGLVVFFTDHTPSMALPYGARFVAVGQSLENCGFTGVTLEEREGQMLFRAMVRNFSAHPQVRSWWIEAEGQRSPETPLELGPGQSHTVQGVFPEGIAACQVVLSGDRFAADDRLPLVRPQPKPLAVLMPPTQETQATVLREIFAAFPHLGPPVAEQIPDVTVTLYDPLQPALPATHAIVFAQDPHPGAAYQTGLLVAEPGPLMDGVNWQGLLVRQRLPLPSRPNDRVLLWQGEQPLILHRRAEEGRQQLLFNFDLHTSNARRLPALAVLLYRFLEQVRAEKVAPAAMNVVAGQKLELARRLGAGAPPLEWREEPLTSSEAEKLVPPVMRERPATDLLRAPVVPGFFHVSQGGQPLLTAAAYFADPQESDFTAAATTDNLEGIAAALAEQHTMADTPWRLWVGVLMAALLLSWWMQAPRAESRPVNVPG